MRIAAIAIPALVVVVLLGSQLLVPTIAERQLASRLTENGGEADVAVSAFPTLRLLFDDGARFEIRASGLDLELDGRLEAFDRLDGFGEVAIAIDELTAGPFALESFTLTRAAPAPYRLTSRGRASPAGVVDLGADRLGIPGGALLGGLAGQALGRAPIPFTLDMQLASDNGEITVVSGGGTVAGVPAGPLAQLLAGAIVARL